MPAAQSSGRGGGERADASLAERLAAIAHEIRTPLALASAAAAALSDDAARLDDPDATADALRVLSAPIRVNAEAILRNLERAERLIAAFHRTAAAAGQAGARRTFALDDVVRDAVTTLEPALRKANVTVEVSAGAPVEVTADPGGVAQVVVNLVLNAVQHGYRGKTSGRVKVAVGRDAGSAGGARLEVRDSGRGIAPELLPRIFDAFVTDAADAGGTGLGLSVVKEIVEKGLGGDVSVESALGKGTAFLVKFPAK